MATSSSTNPIEILQELPEDGIKFRIMCFALSDLYSSYNLMMCFIRSGTIRDLFQSNYRIAKLLKYLNYFRAIALSQSNKTPTCIFGLFRGAMRYLYEKDSKVQAFFGPLDGKAQGLMRGYEGQMTSDEKVSMLDRDSAKQYKMALENGRSVELNIKAMKYVCLMTGLELVKHRLVIIKDKDKKEQKDEDKKTKKLNTHSKPIALSLYLQSVLENKEEKAPKKKQEMNQLKNVEYLVNTEICHYCTKNGTKPIPENWFQDRKISTRSVCATCASLLFKIVSNNEVKTMLNDDKCTPKTMFSFIRTTCLVGTYGFLEYQVKQYREDNSTNGLKRKQMDEDSNGSCSKQIKSRKV